jgi:hypothetical protein
VRMIQPMRPRVLWVLLSGFMLWVENKCLAVFFRDGRLTCGFGIAEW